jgi:branched-subunit amino acid aminotransferase/4-amino-4-deoxychorismate lyase
MIWVKGKIVADDALSISVLDRTFEHGLGLFETLRTWDGRPTLLGRHLDRLRRSADLLRVALDDATLPGAEDVCRLLEAEGLADGVIRITLSGGLGPETPGILWMRARPLPSPFDLSGVRVRSTWRILEGDPLARHKSLNYWARRLAFEEATAAGFQEDLGRNGSGRIFEGSRTNLFLVSESILITPGFEGHRTPFLPGIMAGVVKERARALGMVVQTDDLGTSLDELERADEVFLTNSGRGIIPVAELGPHDPEEPLRVVRYEVPGPVTRLLLDELNAWL